MVKHPQIDQEKVDRVKNKIRRKSNIWFSFLLFGWSYGSLGSLGLQVIWYVTPILSGIVLYQNSLNGQFTIYTAIAMMASSSWIVWSIARLFTLNKAVDKYNLKIANFFGLNPEEKYSLGIED